MKKLMAVLSVSIFIPFIRFILLQQRGDYSYRYRAAIADGLDFILIPAIIIFIPLIYLLIRKKFSKSYAYRLFFKVWVVTTILISVVMISSLPSNSNQQTNYLFPQNSGEFSVLFPEKPSVSNSKIGALLGKTAIFIDTKNHSFLKAEYFEIDKQTIKNTTKDNFSKMVEEYLYNSGLKKIKMNYSENPANKNISFKASKIIEHNGENIPAMYEGKAFIGSRSVFVIYAGAKSSNYPTPQTFDFINSIKNK
jgi:hypothetical protein